MLKSNFRLIILFAIAVTLPSLVFAQPEREAGKQPIHKEALLKAFKQLHRGDSQADIVAQVRLRGVDFEVTSAIEADLRAAGAGSEMIEAIRANYRPPACLARSPTQGTGRGYAESLRGAVKLEMVEVPPGSFCMGDATRGAKPVHRVTIAQAFFMGKYEVTQAQWQAVMGNNPSRFKGDDSLPVEQVSWNDAQEFITKLNQMGVGYTYRVPSDAEWEYAARAGRTGDDDDRNIDDDGWHADNSGMKSNPVGTKQPNAFGLYDMWGNVAEWCLDWHHSNYTGAPTDGTAWISGAEPTWRVIRGGAWNHVPSLVGFSARYIYEPDTRYFFIGFRVVAVARTR